VSRGGKGRKREGEQGDKRGEVKGGEKEEGKERIGETRKKIGIVGGGKTLKGGGGGEGGGELDNRVSPGR